MTLEELISGVQKKLGIQVHGRSGQMLFVLYVSRFQIRPEEQVLKEGFGAPFEDYVGRVGRWL